jgi:hypothetical protein
MTIFRRDPSVEIRPRLPTADSRIKKFLSSEGIATLPVLATLQVSDKEPLALRLTPIMGLGSREMLSESLAGAVCRPGRRGANAVRRARPRAGAAGETAGRGGGETAGRGGGETAGRGAKRLQ